jgi:hypothetical protein
MQFEFEAEVFEWRGPAPFYFAATPEEVSQDIDEVKSQLTYGWGMVPAKLTIGSTTVLTALTPKNGNYYVPLKDALRKANNIEIGHVVRIFLEL